MNNTQNNDKDKTPISAPKLKIEAGDVYTIHMLGVVPYTEDEIDEVEIDNDELKEKMEDICKYLGVKYEDFLELKFETFLEINKWVKKYNNVVYAKYITKIKTYKKKWAEHIGTLINKKIDEDEVEKFLIDLYRELYVWAYQVRMILDIDDPDDLDYFEDPENSEDWPEWKSLSSEISDQFDY
jgi:hypothetical protein